LQGLYAEEVRKDEEKSMQDTFPKVWDSESIKCQNPEAVYLRLEQFDRKQVNLRVVDYRGVLIEAGNILYMSKEGIRPAQDLSPKANIARERDGKVRII
jgi:hypothetical protein